MVSGLSLGVGGGTIPWVESSHVFERGWAAPSSSRHAFVLELGIVEGMGDGRVKQLKYRLSTPDSVAWVQILALPPTIDTTLGKLVYPGFIICECSSLTEL